MVIVEFANHDDKYKLFAHRDNLRAKGIRISNDISYIKRQTLKDLRKKGLTVYFKGEKLVIVNQPNQDVIQTRIFKRASRPSDKPAQQRQENSVSGTDMETNENAIQID